MVLNLSLCLLENKVEVLWHKAEIYLLKGLWGNEWGLGLFTIIIIEVKARFSVLTPIYLKTPIRQYSLRRYTFKNLLFFYLEENKFNHTLGAFDLEKS